MEDQAIIDIIHGCMNQQRKSQEKLLYTFLGFAKIVVMRYSGSREEMEEMVNDGFIKVFNNLGNYKPQQPFKAWLRTIMVNTAIDYYRRGKTRPVHDDLEYVTTIEPTPDALSRLSAEDILKLVQKLSPSYRIVFTLYVVEGYTHKEIAEKLGISVGTSKSNLQDARHKLQKMISAEFQPHGISLETNNYKSHGI